MAVDRSTVEKILADARQAVDAAEIPEDLRPLAFGKAVDLLSGDVTPTRRRKEGNGGNGGGDGGGGDVDERLGKIAKRMHVDGSKLAYVYELDGNDVSLIIQRPKLPSDKANATRELALLYAAARQAGGYDETHTKSAEIKTKCADMGVLDEANFAAHLMAKKDWFTWKGKGASREFKVTQPGYEEAGKIVTRITGGGS